MGMNAGDRVVIKVDASVFERDVGELVEKGETLGRWAGRAVQAPFNAIVESISFDADSHALIVILVEGGQCASDGQREAS
jgi:hypothetical protein